MGLFGVRWVPIPAQENMQKDPAGIMNVLVLMSICMCVYLCRSSASPPLLSTVYNCIGSAI